MEDSKQNFINQRYSGSILEENLSLETTHRTFKMNHRILCILFLLSLPRLRLRSSREWKVKIAHHIDIISFTLFFFTISLKTPFSNESKLLDNVPHFFDILGISMTYRHLSQRCRTLFIMPSPGILLSMSLHVTETAVLSSSKCEIKS